MVGPLVILPVGPAAATTKVEEMLMEQTLMTGPLGGCAGARERPPPYAEDVDGDTRPLLEGPDLIYCPNMHWYLQQVV
jgi:hypothetical protein